MCKLHVVCLKLRGLLFKEFHTRRSSIVIVSTSWTQLRKRNYSLFLLYSWIAPGRVIPSMKAGSFCADLNKLFFNVEMILWISTSWMLTKLWTNLICYSNVTYSYFIQNFYNVYYLKWMNLSNNFAIKPKIITNRKKWKARFFVYTLNIFQQNLLIRMKILTGVLILAKNRSIRFEKVQKTIIPLSIVFLLNVFSL